MKIRDRILFVLVAFACTAGMAATSHALTFERDNIYTTRYFTNTIIQYDVDGSIVESMTVDSQYADELKGLAFGPDGLLYVTAVRGSGLAVLVLNEEGVIHETYSRSVYVRGNLSYGKLAVDEEHLYVAGQRVLTRFDVGDPASGTTIYTENQIYDVEILPTGNLLVASAYRIAEITSDGVFVRNISSTFPRNFTDIRGVEYDGVTDKIFVTHLGHTGFYMRLMRFDGSTGAYEDDVVFTYADDLFVMSSGEILVGSRTETPRIYNQALEVVAELEGSDRMFVTQYVDPNPAIDVLIDIKPGSPSNPINPTSRGKIPVAILGSETFDVAEIDVTTLGFGPNLAAPAHKAGGHLSDVDGDGYTDLVSHFATAETGIAFGDLEACVSGETVDEIPMSGCDVIETVPACGIGFEAALLLPLMMRMHRRREGRV